MSSAIALKSLTKQFASSENGWDNSIAVDDVTLEVGERENSLFWSGPAVVASPPLCD